MIMVEFRIMDHNSVVKAWVQEKHGAVGGLCLVGLNLIWIYEGVAHPIEYGGHVAAPQRLVHHVLLDGGAQGESVLPHTANNI